MKFPSQIIKLHQEILNNDSFADSLYEKSKHIQNQLIDNNAIITFIDDLKINKTNSLLYGIPYSLKDNISTKDIKTTGGSQFLSDYIPCFNATIYELIKNTGARLISKDNMDEFGLGGTGTFSGFGICKNFYDKERIAGGSSSGSATMVASGAAIFAIGTDTGDSIRHPASYNGIVGFKPSYGLVSRYGIFPYAPSMDHVGIFAKYVADIAIVLDEIVKFDNNDYSSRKSLFNFYKNLQPIANPKVCIIKQAFDYMDEQALNHFKNVLKILQKHNIVVDIVDFNDNLLKALDGIYKVISYAEASSCYGCLTGIPFGNNIGGNNYQEIIFNNRTKFLGSQLKRRFIIGAFATKHENFNNLFIKAKKVRTLIINEINNLLNTYDFVINPGASSTAPLINDVINNTWKSTICDDILMIANFAGLPSITIPAGKINNLPLGINIFSKIDNDQFVLDLAVTLENILKEVNND